MMQNVEDRVWPRIVASLFAGQHLTNLTGNRPFRVIALGEETIHLQLPSSALRLEKSRFLSAYQMLAEKRGTWVPIGASRDNARPDTLEGRIKAGHNGQMNGLSTATWVAAILAHAFDHIVFNGRPKGQALMMLKGE